MVAMLDALPRRRTDRVIDGDPRGQGTIGRAVRSGATNQHTLNYPQFPPRNHFPYTQATSSSTLRRMLQNIEANRAFAAGPTPQLAHAA